MDPNAMDIDSTDPTHDNLTTTTQHDPTEEEPITAANVMDILKRQKQRKESTFNTLPPDRSAPSSRSTTTTTTTTTTISKPQSTQPSASPPSSISPSDDLTQRINRFSTVYRPAGLPPLINVCVVCPYQTPFPSPFLLRTHLSTVHPDVYTSMCLASGFSGKNPEPGVRVREWEYTGMAAEVKRLQQVEMEHLETIGSLEELVESLGKDVDRLEHESKTLTKQVRFNFKEMIRGWKRIDRLKIEYKELREQLQGMACMFDTAKRAMGSMVEFHRSELRSRDEVLRPEYEQQLEEETEDVLRLVCEEVGENGVGCGAGGGGQGVEGIE
jgi:hypothetical protein